MAKLSKDSLRRKALVLACLAALAAPAAHGADFDATVFFGDSLTDAGTFGARFTTNPGPVWAETLANRLGTSATPATAGGPNYAVGGARVTLLPGVPNAAPTSTATPITDQVSAYLAANPVQGKALYTVWGGANDIFVATALGAGAPAYLTQTAGELAAQIQRLQAAGARYILVPNVPDIGATPFGVAQGPAGQAFLTQLSSGYNRDLYAAIAARGLRVIALDTFTLLNEVIANPSLYGFANVSVPACGATPSLVCTSADFVAPEAAQTFLFADGVHPTTAGHSVLGDYAASVIAAPGQISLLPETAVKTRVALVDRIHTQIRERERGRNLWVSADGQRTSVEDSAGDGAGITVGADLFERPGAVIGAAVGLSRVKPEFTAGGNYTQDETHVSLYAGWKSGGLRLSGALSYGELDHEVNREVRLGSARRTASGSPGGNNISLGVEAFYRVSAGSVSHGPLAGLLAQRVKIDGYSENDAGSAGLRYGEQTRNSAIGRLGWHAAYDAGWWSPYVRASYDRELHDTDREVEAQLITAPDLPTFSLPAARPGRNFATLTLGSSLRLGRGWNASLALAHTAAQSGADHTAAFATLSTEF